MAEQKYKTLKLEEGDYKTTLNKAFLNRKAYVKENPYEFKAIIPGIIRKIDVKKNRQVKEGDDLFILEAMKMRNVVKSHMNGIIESVNVKVGEQVTKGQIIIKFQED